MSYYPEAFGGFNPQRDRDAALKMALNSIFSHHRIEPLVEVLLANGMFGGVEGDPGWSLDRREPASVWPDGAEFRAYVYPEFFSLACPEFFCTREELFDYVRAIVRVYRKRHPERDQDIRPIEQIVGAE